MSIIRKLTLISLFALPLAAVVGLIRPTTARADVDMSDYNTYWQVATDPTPPDPSLDYNTYWAEVQAKQQWQDRQQ
jgi:hypothetical protein